MVLSTSVLTSIEIDAPADKVWDVLLDWKAYPTWNPFLKSVEGDAKEGATIKIHAQPPGQTGMTFRPVLLKVSPSKELRWQGRLLVPGLFTGQHYFIIEELAPSKVKFVHGEDFFGLLVPLMRGSFPAVEQGFQGMNVKLKELAEKA